MRQVLDGIRRPASLRNQIASSRRRSQNDAASAGSRAQWWCFPMRCWRRRSSCQALFGRLATLVVIANVLGMVADRQIGLRVRSFTPFFEAQGRIQLRTTGAYGIVRHPIYAAGVCFQVGVFLASGYWAVAASCVVFTLGAL